MNEELERRNAIYLRGEFIPISQVTFEIMCDCHAIFPLHYDFNELPLETQGGCMLAPLEIKRLLGLNERENWIIRLLRRLGWLG